MREQGAEEIRFVRREILLRIGIQNMILILLMPLLLLSIIAASALRSEAAFIALGYVGVAGMGALYWIHSAARTVQIKAYLRAVERAGGAAGWEAWLAANPVRGALGSRWFISTKGVFVGSQIAAILVCGVLAGGLAQPVLLSLALGVAALTAVLLIQPKMPS
jgi:hypothetical protein